MNENVIKELYNAQLFNLDKAKTHFACGKKLFASFWEMSKVGSHYGRRWAFQGKIIRVF